MAPNALIIERVSGQLEAPSKINHVIQIDEQPVCKRERTEARGIRGNTKRDSCVHTTAIHSSA